jgi:hypothetical protein
MNAIRDCCGPAWCYVCDGEIHREDYWLADISHITDHEWVLVCTGCVNTGAEFVKAKLEQNANDAFDKYRAARELATNLQIPSATEIYESTIVVDLPFSRRRVSDDEWRRWLGTRKGAARHVDPETCEIRQEDNRFYVRDAGSRGWIAQEDLPPEKVKHVLARLMPVPPAPPEPYSERDADAVPF